MDSARSGSLAIVKIVFALGLSIASAYGWFVYSNKHFPDQPADDIFGIQSFFPLGLGLAALLTTAIFDRNFKAIGFRIPNLRYFTMAIPLAMALTLAPFILNIALNLTGVAKPSPGSIGLIIIGFPVLIVLAAGEEMMWRGVLFTNLARFFGFTATSIIIGLISSFWYLAIFIVTKYSDTDESLMFVVPMHILLTTCSAFVYVYLRMVSRSIWPCVFLHAFISLLMTAFIDPIEKPIYPWSSFFMHDFGFLYVFAAIAGALYYSSRIKKIYF